MLYLSFASFIALYNPVCLTYEKTTATIQFLIMRLMVRKIQ